MYREYSKQDDHNSLLVGLNIRTAELSVNQKRLQDIQPGLEGTLESTDLGAESHVEEDHHLFNAEIQRRAASCLRSGIAHVAHVAG